MEESKVGSRRVQWGRVGVVDGSVKSATGENYAEARNSRVSGPRSQGLARRKIGGHLGSSWAGLYLSFMMTHVRSKLSDFEARQDPLFHESLA